VPPPATARDEANSTARGAPRDRLRILVRFLVVALLLAAGATSLASEPGLAAGSERAGLGSEALIAGWLFVFVALSALYSFDRRYRAKVGVAAHGTGPRSPGAEAAPVAPQAVGRAERAAEAQRRPIELLLKKKPAATAERPRPPVIPTTKLNLPESLLRRPAGRGVTECDEECFSVADAAEPSQAPRAEPAPPAASPPAAVAPAPAAAAPEPSAASEPTRLERCLALRAEERFEEAARVAREGLAGEDHPGPLLIELSRAEFGLGRVNAAIDTARDAHFACRSRESISHLIRLLIETRRFGGEDGPMLRRAAARHPEQPLLRHAAGVFESMYGDPRRAEQELREALRLATDAELRAAIERDLARLRAAAERSGRQPS
jgi:hypothetical protein